MGRQPRRLFASGVRAVRGLGRRFVRWWGQAGWPRRTALVVAALVVLYLIAASVQLWRIRAELNGGKGALSGLTIDKVDAAGGIGPLADRADAHLRKADRIAQHSLVLAPLRVVPVVGTQIRAVAHLTRATRQLGDAARIQADRIQAQIATGGSSDKRVALLDTVLSAVDALQQRVDTLDLNVHGWLLPPVTDARQQLVDELTKAKERLADSRMTVSALRTFLDHDHQVLILAANNAEMRGGNGMALSAGVAQIHHGEITVGDFTNTADLFLWGGPVPVPPDLEHTYGDFFIGQEWRGTNASPNFPEVAPLYQAMAKKAGLGDVDGVILVDADALQALLATTGPVSLSGTTYSASNVIQQVLNENYLIFGSSDMDVHSERVDLQSQIAKKVFAEFNTRPVSAIKLARNLLAVTPGRHVLAWSADPTIQSAWHQLGVDGALRPDGLLVSLENVSANKLDYYLVPIIDLRTERQKDGSWLVTLRVSVYNPPRQKTSQVIEGGTPYVKPGDHRVYLDIHLPGDTYDVKALPRDALPVVKGDKLVALPNAENLPMAFTVIGTDGPMKVVGNRYIIPKGTTRTVSIQFRLPHLDDHVYVLPSGRWNGQVWRYGSSLFLDNHTVKLPLKDQ